MATFAMRAHAYTETVNGIEWNFIKNLGEAYISNPSYNSAIPDDTTGAITIPSVLGGCPVTKIDDLAFLACKGLTSVTIPDSVMSIGEGAFAACSGLESVTISSNVTSIGKYAFAACGNVRSVTIPQCVCSTLLSSVFRSSYQAITNVVVSDGVTAIEDFAFKDCISLARVSIPDSVTSIGEGAFNNCSEALFDTATFSGVKLVDGWAVGYTDDLPSNLELSGVRGIGDYAFEECDCLESVRIPGSVKSVGYGAFDGCYDLTDVQIDAGVASIGGWAFGNCEGLTSVTIPASVTNIEERAFYNCCGITNIIFKGNAPAAFDSSFEGVASEDVASGCIAYVSPSSTGWGVEEGQTWHGLTLRFLDAAEDEVVYEIVDFAIEETTQGGVVVRRMIVGVIAKAGETPVRGDADKVMFEATSDLGDWDGAAKLASTVEVLESDGTTLRFRVTPGDGTANSAFLRIRR